MRAAGSHSRAMAVCQAALRPSSATGVVSRRSGASHLAQRQQEQLKRGARLVVEAGKASGQHIDGTERDWAGLRAEGASGRGGCWGC